MELKTQSWIILLILSVAEGAVVNSTQNTSSHLIPCKEGWFLFGDRCYKVFGKSKDITWQSAEVICGDHNGHLVTIQSRELLDFLSIFLLLDVKSDVWIGLNDIEEESNYTWADGSIYDYKHWSYGQPSDRSNKYKRKDCVEMEYEKGKIGWWNDLKCDANRPFICQTIKNEQSMNHDPRFCTDEDDGAWKYQNSCYHTVHEEMSWDDAEDYCQTVFNGHLLTITDSNIDVFLNYVLSDFRREFWIGIKIRAPAQRWKWDRTTQRWSFGKDVRFHKWVTELTLNMNGTCAYMTENKMWSTGPCFQKLPFVCEVDKPGLKKAPEGWVCPELSEDWVDLGGDTCYIFETDRWRQWHEADYFCARKGGHLASISSAAETNLIYPHLSNVYETTMLIGLHRKLSKYREFEWADGTEVEYENWRRGEPSSIYESCGELRTIDMKWNDISCEANGKPYICSAKKVPPSLQKSNKSPLRNCRGSVDRDDSSFFDSYF